MPKSGSFFIAQPAPLSQPLPYHLVDQPHMRRLAFTLLLLANLSAAADPREDALRTLIKRLPPADQEFLAKAKYAGHRPLSQLVRFSNRDGRFIASFQLPPELLQQFEDPNPLLLGIEGSKDAWSIHRRKSGTLDEGLSQLTLICYAPDETGPFQRFTLTSDGNTLSVGAVQTVGNPAFLHTVTISQGEKFIHLTWRLAADQWVWRKLDIADMRHLPTRVPNLMQQYLLPVLYKLGPARPASDVYRVFDQVPPDPRVMQAVMPLVEKLDSMDSTVRDKALDAIRDLGRPAVLATMHLDGSSLTPEQKNRLAVYYASEGWYHVADVEAARKDTAFLTACLEDEDPRVRDAAEQMLAALRVGQTLKR